jgi:hypothetical protein
MPTRTRKKSTKRKSKSKNRTHKTSTRSPRTRSTVKKNIAKRRELAKLPKPALRKLAVLAGMNEVAAEGAKRGDKIELPNGEIYTVTTPTPSQTKQQMVEQLSKSAKVWKIAQTIGAIGGLAFLGQTGYNAWEKAERRRLAREEYESEDPFRGFFHDPTYEGYV